MKAKCKGCGMYKETTPVDSGYYLGPKGKRAKPRTNYCEECRAVAAREVASYRNKVDAENRAIESALAARKDN